MSNRNKTRTISYDRRARIFWGLTVISILALFLYVYAVNATARNIVVRQNLERQMASISTGLSSFEFAYIALKNNVTIDLAYQYGFQEVNAPLYISRTRALPLSFNTLSR